MSPRQYIPVQLASSDVTLDDVEKLDIALAWYGGIGRGGYPGGGYGGGPGFGWGGYGWGRWAVSFLAIFLLFGLLW